MVAEEEVGMVASASAMSPSSGRRSGSAVHDSVATIAAVSGVLSIAGQVGDLAESMIKRNYGAKDSGTILPGHGGFLDRVDALLFAIPVCYAFVMWAIR